MTEEDMIIDWPCDLLWWAVNQSWPDWVYGRIDGRTHPLALADYYENAYAARDAS